MLYVLHYNLHTSDSVNGETHDPLTACECAQCFEGRLPYIPCVFHLHRLGHIYDEMNTDLKIKIHLQKFVVSAIKEGSLLKVVRPFPNREISSNNADWG